MNAAEFEKQLKAKQENLKYYVNYIFPRRAGNIATRFVNGNFLAQGWQGATFQPWKENVRKGRILIKTGKGRRGTSYSTRIAEVRVFNNVLYMAVHNRGFNGTVRVREHKRRTFGRQKVDSGRLTKTGKTKMKTVATLKGVGTVTAHDRKMNIPKRKFMPESLQDSPVLANAITREIEREFKKIFN